MLKGVLKNIFQKWECDFKAERKNEPRLSAFLARQKHCIHKDINARDAMFGGRTSYFAHYKKCSPEESIAFKDFVSLYPTQMIKKPYPVGEPEVINQDFQALDNYWGLVKAKVLPPRGEFIGVLPYRAGGRLTFPLCAVCAELCWQEAECPHGDAARALKGTYTTFELAEALKVGYEILHLCQIWHWPPEKRSTGIFSPYLTKLLGVKMKSKSLPDDWNVEKKRDYVAELNKEFGFDFAPEDFEDNPGLKLVAKIFLNCLWGRLCLNLGCSEFAMVEGYEAVWKKLNDPDVVVQDFEPVSETKMVMACKPAAGKTRDNSAVSLLVGIWTCSYGRLDLLNAMRRVVDIGGKEALLYCDTDSVMHVDKSGRAPILAVGENLGDLSDEVAPGTRITAFCCAAPKVYALEITKNNGEIEYRQKFKGFPNTWRSNQTLNGELFMRQFLEDYERLEIDVHLKSRIRKNKWRAEIKSVDEKKTLKFVSKKRFHDAGDYITYPFGYM